MCINRLLLFVFGLIILSSSLQSQTFCDSDDIPPVLNNCQSDLTFSIPTGECGVQVNWNDPFADADNCNVISAIGAVHFFSFHTGQGNGNDGQLIFYGTDSLTIVGTTNGTPGLGNNVFNVCFYATCSGQLSFNWRARMNNGDGFANDRARLTLTHMVHGANVDAPFTSGNGSQANGVVLSTFIQEGDRLCFEVHSDNTQGVDSLTISDFLFVPGIINVIQTKGPKPGDIVSAGDYNVEYVASDCAGNTSTCSFVIHVLNQTPPSLFANCPQDITVGIGSSQPCETNLNVISPIANDPCTPVYGFTYGMDPTIYGVEAYEAAQAGNGDGIVGTDGLVYLSPGKDSLVMVGINNGTPGNQRNDTSVLRTCIQPKCPGVFTFDWLATISTGSFRRDEAGIIFNGKDSILAVPPSGSYAAGTVSIHSNGVDPLCFYVRSTNMSLEDTFIVTNFSFVSDSLIVIQTSGPDLNNPVGVGKYTVSYEATDCNGNTSTCAFNIAVVRNGSIACDNLINVSLDENCEAFITPDMVVEGNCVAGLTVSLSLDGKAISNPIQSKYIGKKITATIRDTLSGNSCWGFIYVEDKLPPVVECPEPITVFCNQKNYNIPEPVVRENCTTVEKHIFSDLLETYSCDSEIAGKRTIKFYYTDKFGNRSDTCNQCIYFRKIDPLYDISWPRDTIFNCLTIDTVPLPAITGVPTVAGELIYPGWGVCKIAVTYEDQIIQLCPKSYKILRKWTYFDWCRSYDQFITTHYQVIKVIDDKGPVIACAQNITVSTDIWTCLGSVILFPPTVLEECSGTTINVGYKIASQNGSPTYDGTSSSNITKLTNGAYQITGLPYGLSWIIFRVTDECGNFTDCATEVLIEDKVPPIPVCDQKTIVTLTLDGVAKTAASSFDDGSLDNCGIDHFEARRMDNGVPCNMGNGNEWTPFVYFCCEDVGKTLLVAVRVWDIHGNSNTCMVEVVVQDKVAPLIVCPPDITVSCEFEFTDLSVFGTVRSNSNQRQIIEINDPKVQFSGPHIDGYAYDGCGFTITETDTFDLKCGNGRIFRKFEATDRGGLKSTCIQTIWINDYTPDNVKITWPSDYFSNTTCLSKPLVSPDVTGKPVITGADKCSNVLQSYDDQVFTLDPDACIKILRKWTVIDWCVYSPNDKNPKGYWTWTQVIKIINAVPPVFVTRCNDLTVDVFEPGCQGYVSLVASAIDDCTDSTELVWTHLVDINNDGTIDTGFTGNGKDASKIYPIGIHLITFKVKDACNNEASCSFKLTVRDGKKPTPYCIGQIITTVMPSTQNIQIWAKDFNLKSEDNCTPKDSLHYFFLVNGHFVPSMVLNCSNIGLNIVQVYVVDQAGNSDYCEATIEVQDPNQVCPTGHTIQGKIYTLKNSAVKDALVHWDRQVPPGTNSILTDENGIYTFRNLAPGLNYSVRAEKNSNFVEGVTTYDIVLIQRHILGIQTFDSPYKYLAADVNASCTVTAADIAEIRKLILGKISAFARCPSWRFVPVDSKVPDNSPCVFEETINYKLTGNEMNSDFYGIKMGDVSMDVDGGKFKSFTQRVESGCQMYALDQYLNTGETRKIPFFIHDHMSYEGMQEVIEFDADRLNILSVESGQLTVTEDQYTIQGNKLTLSLAGHLNQIVKPGEAVFYLVVQALNDLQICDHIRLDQSALNAEWYDGNLKIHPIQFQCSKLNEIADGSTTKLFQNKPNPFNESTRVSFYLADSQDVDFVFYEVNGKVIYKLSKFYSKGYHEFDLKKSELNSYGVLFMQMNTENFTDTRRIVLIR